MGPGGVRQGTISKCFVNGTEVVSAATTPRSTTEITCNQVNFLRKQDGTKSENELHGDAFLPGNDVHDFVSECVAFLRKINNPFWKVSVFPKTSDNFHWA